MKMRRLSSCYTALHISPNSNYFLSYHDSQVRFSHFSQEIYIVPFLCSLSSQGYEEPPNFQTQCSHVYPAGTEAWNSLKSQKRKVADMPQTFWNDKLSLYSSQGTARVGDGLLSQKLRFCLSNYSKAVTMGASCTVQRCFLKNLTIPLVLHLSDILCRSNSSLKWMQLHKFAAVEKLALCFLCCSINLKNFWQENWVKWACTALPCTKSL